MTGILVTGATGIVGSQLVQELKARGETVRAFVRDPERAAESLGDGVELVQGDFSDMASIRRALAGVNRVFLACANHPRQVEYETNVIDAAAAAGVGRLVKLSALGAEVGSPVAFWDWHGRIEQHLRASGIPFVLLRPAFNMTNLLGAAEGVRHADSLFAPADGARVAMIDPSDVAQVAAVALKSGGHEGHTYVLTGPEVLAFDRVATELSAATGRSIRFIAVPDEAARQALVRTGMPDFVAGQIVTIFGRLRQGSQARTTDAVHVLTGREPRSFGDFARDHALLFAS